MMKDAIGGYFELELLHKGGFPHDDGALLNSGRNALEYVLQSLPDVRLLWVPYYTCKVILEPLEKLNVEYSFYHIDRHLELNRTIDLQKGEYLLYTNYFGIKDEYVRALSKRYGSNLIIDNAQSWFAEPIENVSTFYSPRKFVGVPDGGIAFCHKGIDLNQFEIDRSYERCSHLLKRIDLGASEGYGDFRENSQKLSNQPIKRMSNLTQALLSGIDFDAIKKKRLSNFSQLHTALRDSNKFEMPEMSSFECPMVYPYLTDDHSLKQRLIENRVFVATYWPNVREWVKEGMLEYELAELLLPIPCDQRYDLFDLSKIITLQ